MGISRHFLDTLDVRLKAILASLGPGDDLAITRLQARSLCDDMTDHEGERTDKLLFPGWEDDYKQLGGVSYGIFHQHNGLLTEEQVEYLIRVFDQLARLVVNGRTEYDRKDIASDLRTALGGYLTLRGHTLEPPRSEGGNGDQGRSSDEWYHPADAEPPSQFKEYGPLQGTKKLLGRCLGGKGGRNDRTLEYKARTSVVWVRRLARTSFEVWFRNQRAFATANTKKIEIERSKP